MKKLTTLFLIVLLQSCMTYRKAQRKFADTKTDTIKVVNTVTIPRDSIRTVIKNDTQTFYREIQQGRARVIIEKTPTYTYIKADCDSASKTVQTVIPQTVNTWGISPWYEKAFWACIGIIALLIIRDTFKRPK